MSVIALISNELNVTKWPGALICVSVPAFAVSGATMESSLL